MKIYHNPRCSKSRQTLAIIEKKTSNFEIVRYLEDPLKFNDIKVLLIKLNIKPIKIVRTKETIWREKFKGKEINDNEIINILAENPKLMERPIVETKEKAIIGRPPENVLELFN
tara:strand:+ start:10971 stop:11312 length:342 start_codon:yes stop_codon:yes gene_type:complete